MKTSQPRLSVVVPVYNEAAGIEAFHRSLTKVLADLSGVYEVVYCDDGSRDDTVELLTGLSKHDPCIKLVVLSRNFGKEIAISAGLQAAHGEAILTLDADGQHPVELIPEFVKRWQAGSRVVIGLRTSNQKEGFIKKYGSKIFYNLFTRLMGVKLVQGATDFRLIDASVQKDFLQLTERNRISRGLIDWLGYKQDFIEFTAKPRMHGQASYSVRKLFKLAVDSMIAMSISPLYITMYLGAIILPLSTLLGGGMLLNTLLGDRLGLHATGSAYLMVLLLFLVGVLLVSQGIIGLYISHIHTEAQNRPLFIVDKQHSVGIDEA